MKTVRSILPFLLLFFSCKSNQSKNKYKFWDTSKFNFVDTALGDGEEIKVLYTSQGPDDNKNLDYYIQLVVVSQKTGDTVNILTTLDNNLSIEDSAKLFNYISQNNIASKIVQTNPEKLKDIKNINQINNTPQKKILKVARDPDFDNIADNSFPTVIGMLGSVNK